MEKRTKMTVRENAKQAKLSDNVVRRLSKTIGKRVSKAQAYLEAMKEFALQIGL